MQILICATFKHSCDLEVGPNQLYRGVISAVSARGDLLPNCNPNLKALSFIWAFGPLLNSSTRLSRSFLSSATRQSSPPSPWELESDGGKGAIECERREEVGRRIICANLSGRASCSLQRLRRASRLLLFPSLWSSWSLFIRCPSFICSPSPPPSSIHPSLPRLTALSCRTALNNSCTLALSLFLCFCLSPFPPCDAVCGLPLRWGTFLAPAHQKVEEGDQ